MLVQDVYRVEREILTHGEEYEVYKEEYNSVGEPTGRIKKLLSFRGLFHVSEGYHLQTVSDATVTHAKGNSMILCMWEDIEDVKREYFLYKNKKKYVITDINDIGGYGRIADLSLEVVVNGAEQY